jgi:chaperonin GroES
MNIKLMGDRVLVKVDEAETKTSSGLILAKTSEPQDYQTGTVVSVGVGKQTDQGNVIIPYPSLGDKVIFQYGSSIIVEGESVSLVNGNDIIAILD